MRILFVSMPGSVHVVRWIDQICDQGWDIHLFPSKDSRFRAGFRNITVYGVSFNASKKLDRSVRTRVLWPLPKGARALRWLGNRLPPTWSDASTWLAWIIDWLKPDIIHSQEFQHSAYLTLEAKSKFKGRFPPWIVANWGSDIYLFGRLPEHVDKIKAVLSACDYYHCECHRDVTLAREFGFNGEVLPVFPVTGGFDLEYMRQFRRPGPTSARRLIALKGYQNWAGRALVGLRAIELCADVLQGYRVVVYLPKPDVKLAAKLVTHSTGIPIEVETDGWSREDILRMHGQARVSIGLSISDAASTSLLEAMIMGSFPIQSCTACVHEWIVDGQTGLIVPPEDPAVVAAAIRRAISDDTLVDCAAEQNARVAAERLDSRVIRPQVIAMYEKVASQGKRHVSRAKHQTGET